MKLFVFACLAFAQTAAGADANPIQKVVEMISDLEAKVLKEGEGAHKLYSEFAEMCEDRSRELHFNIKTAKAEIADLKAVIEDKSAQIASLGSKIEELAGSVADAESELKKATEIRKKEAADFATSQKELTDTISTIERASNIIQREMAKGGSLVQLKSASNLEQALQALVQASAIATADASTLTALLQSSSQTSDEDAGAPDAAVYESQSGGITEALDGLLSKAEDQLATLRKEEATAKNNYELTKQSLEDEIKFSKQDMDKAKKSLASNSEKKATAEGDLEATTKDLHEDQKTLDMLHHDCMSQASQYEDETKSRGEELKALATAKKIIVEATGGATEQTYGLNQVSFLQTSSAANGAMRILRKLAFHQKSAALAQLSRRVESAFALGSQQGANPFEKVVGLINDMLDKLQKEAEADATHKAYCDKEMGETKAKKDDKTAEIEKMTTAINQKTAHSKKLREEAATLQSELGALTKEQADMDRLRQEERAAYDENKPELEQGLEGIKQALKVLRDYYAKDDKDHGSADGAASGIIGLLEVTEADFAKGLAEMVTKEESQARAYKKETNENEVLKATKQEDLKHKTAQAAALDKSVAETKSDRDGVQEELDAVNEYFEHLKGECVAKPESYEERKAAREAEIAGLKEALSVLEDESALVQRASSHRTLRGRKQTQL